MAEAETKLQTSGESYSQEFEDGDVTGKDDPRINPLMESADNMDTAVGTKFVRKGNKNGFWEEDQVLWLSSVARPSTEVKLKRASHASGWAGPDRAEHLEPHEVDKFQKDKQGEKKKKADNNRFNTGDRKPLQQWIKQGCPGGVPTIAGEMNRSIAAVERFLARAPNVKMATGGGWKPNDRNPEMKAGGGLGGTRRGKQLAVGASPHASAASFPLSQQLTDTMSSMANRNNLTMSSM